MLFFCLLPLAATAAEPRFDGVVRQSRDASCGAAALATLLGGWLGDPVGEGELLDALAAALPQEEWELAQHDGLSLADLLAAVRLRGHRAEWRRLAPDQLDRLPAPMVVRLLLQEGPHFAVLKGVYGGEAYLADPADGNLRLPLADFIPLWAPGGSGLALAVERSDGGHLAATPLRPDALSAEERRARHLLPAEAVLRDLTALTEPGRTSLELVFDSLHDRSAGTARGAAATLRYGLTAGDQLALSLPYDDGAAGSGWGSPAFDWRRLMWPEGEGWPGLVAGVTAVPALAGRPGAAALQLAASRTVGGAVLFGEAGVEWVEGLGAGRWSGGIGVAVPLGGGSASLGATRRAGQSWVEGEWLLPLSERLELGPHLGRADDGNWGGGVVLLYRFAR